MLKITHILKLIDKKKELLLIYAIHSRKNLHVKERHKDMKKNADFYDLKNTIYEMEKCSKSKKNT